MLQGSDDYVITPDTTIYIITYNYGRFLAGAIESALAQDVPVNVAVVDDGSTDSSRNVAAGFGSRIEYLWKPNGGLSDARNYALTRCSTPYLLFLDADDRLPPNFVRVSREALAADAAVAFAYVQAAHFESDQERAALTPTTDFPSFSIERLKRGNYILATSLMRRSAISGLMYDKHIRQGLEDWEFYIQVVRRGFSGRLVRGTVLRYREHNESMGKELQRRSKARRLTYARIFLKHWRFFGVRALLGFVERSARYRVSSLRIERRGANTTK